MRCAAANDRLRRCSSPFDGGMLDVWSQETRRDLIQTVYGRFRIWCPGREARTMFGTPHLPEGSEERMAQRNPSWRARKFGDQLRELRKDCGMTSHEVGEILGRGQAYVVRFENGRYPVGDRELVQLMDLYHISDMDQRERLLRDSVEVAKRGWWEGYVTDKAFADFLWAENRASSIKIFQLDTVPGLLQTRAFAESLIKAGPNGDDELQVRRDLEQRQMRSRVLKRDSAPEVQFLVSEAILWQRGAAFEVLAEQFEHLLKIVELPNVELRVLPLESRGHTEAAIATGFRILEMPDDWPTLVQIETGPAGSVVLEEPDIDSFLTAFAKLWDDSALSPGDSVAKIKTIAEELK
ncbi:helix-turn-helix domain-containing protein [Glycomyces sp. NPDC048151]|uniref:helix-turn-helix domain-containing protein n=1 Tax=Glycomyces sp. NPDC048151 TaxID=3364002 RepID=UPI00371B0FFE